MAKIATITHQTWDEFKRDLIPQLYGPERVFVRGSFLFRGLGNADWHLTSSFDRRFSYLAPQARLRVWDSLLTRFRAACLDAGVMGPDADEVRLLALGQHYGLPTRLIDWTLSPYVASFFSFRDALFSSRSAHVAIWALDARASIWTRDMGVEVVSAPAHENVRLRNQSGRFTLSRTPFADLEEYVAACATEEVALVRFVLPAHEAVRALADLDAMGVNPQHLFPDLTGMSEGVALAVACEAPPAGEK